MSKPRHPERADIYTHDDIDTEDGGNAGATIMLFFTRTMSRAGYGRFKASLDSQLRNIHWEATLYTGNALGLTWWTNDDKDRTGEEKGVLADDVKLIIIGALAAEFGWDHDPRVGKFSSEEERHQLMRQHGVDWYIERFMM